VLELDDLGVIARSVLAFATKSNSPNVSLDLLSLSNSLKHSFLGPNEPLLVIIVFDLDRD